MTTRQCVPPVVLPYKTYSFAKEIEAVSESSSAVYLQEIQRNTLNCTKRIQIKARLWEILQVKRPGSQRKDGGRTYR